MKILMLGWELPPYNSGGLGTACYRISKALSDGGVDIDFVLPYTASHDIDFMKIHGATSFGPLDQYSLGAYDKLNKIVKVEEPNYNGVLNLCDVQRQYVRFVEFLTTDMSPDVIHVHDWLTVEAGIRARQITGAPLVMHVHATEYDRSGGNYGNPLVRDIEYQGLMMADRIITVSDHTKKIIIKEYDIPADKIEVVHNIVDNDYFDQDYEYNDKTFKYFETLKKEGYTVVLTVTRFTVQKGLTFFLNAAAKALKRYDKLVFLIAGDGEQRDELIKMTADLNIADKVFFTGFIRGSKWRDAFNIGDIFVMSSVSEPFGQTALEAAYHNEAVIVTKQSGVGEILDHIFRYDFWDEDALADKIVGLATSKALLETMKRDIKEEYDNLSWNEVADTYMRIYGSLPKANRLIGSGV